MIKLDFINKKEVLHVSAAIIVLALVIGFSSILTLDYENITKAVLFSIAIIATSVYAKKGIAHLLDADVEHEIWTLKRYWFRPHDHFKNPFAIGIVLPLILTLLTKGIFKFMAVLTYEARALKYRAAKRFGYYSFTELTEWHNSLIGSGGILAVLLLALAAYLIPVTGLEPLARFAIYYAFFNMIPFSKLDGAQIFYGSRILYVTMALVTLIFTAYALVLI